MTTSDRIRNSDDPTFRRFADVFHHRMLSLWYRARADAEPTVHFDRPDTDRFALYVGAMFGLGLPSTRDRDAMPDRAKLHYAGRLAAQTRSPDGLRDLLSGYFSMPVEIDEFIGQWIEIPETYYSRLGSSPDTCTLGQTATVGRRIWECQNKFRIVVGPLGYDEYGNLLPGSSGLERLCAVVRNYSGDELQWDVRLILRKAEVPRLRLDGAERLGWTTWVTTNGLAEDPGDLILNALQEEPVRLEAER